MFDLCYNFTSNETQSADNTLPHNSSEERIEEVKRYDA